MSALRKWFSSNSMLRIVQIFFCLTAIGTFIQAEYYRVNYMTGNRFFGNDMTGDGSSYLFIKRDDNNSYTAQFEKIIFTINNEVVITDCDEFKPVATALRKPFKVFLDDNAQFKSMKVSKDDVDLSIAIKYILATTLQANKQKVQEQTDKFNFFVEEISYLGKCTARYLGLYNARKKTYEFTSYKQTDTCSGLESSASKDDQQFADNICRSTSDKSSEYKFISYNSFLNVDLKAEGFKQLIVKEIVNYKPFKNKGDLFFNDYKTSFTLLDGYIPSDLKKQKGSSRDPEPFNDADSKDVKELPYINIDRSMVQGPKSNYLAENYKVIACQPVIKNTYLALLNIGANCAKK